MNAAPVKEFILISPFDLDGKAMVDIRYWRNTPTGPKPTRKGIEVEQRLVTQVITTLQKAHATFSSHEAKKEAGVQG